MKQFKYIVWALFAVITFVACTDDDHITMKSEVNLELSASSTNLVLTKDEADNNALTLTVAKPEYGFAAGANYSLVFILEGETQTVSLGTDLEKTYTVAALNSLLINFGAIAGKETTVTVYATALLGANTTFSSEKVSLMVTPYSSVLDLSTTWGVVGSATTNGWNGPDMPFFINTGNSEEMVAYVVLSDGEIKFRENNAWDNNYGGIDGTLSEGGANIAVTAGTYKITVNLTALTYSVEAYTWGLVGSATTNGWDGPDMALEYDPTSDMWKALVTLADGEIKVRLNNSWGTNYGDDGADGTFDAGGANIAVTAGNYLVTVDLNNLTYELKAVDNLWGVIGSATPGGWDSDTDMFLDYNQENVWYINGLTLTDGEIKFRANDAWSLNYGDDGADGSLEASGANIAVTAGTYDIVLNLSDESNPIYTITASE